MFRFDSVVLVTLEAKIRYARHIALPAYKLQVS